MIHIEDLTDVTPAIEEYEEGEKKLSCEKKLSNEKKFSFEKSYLVRKKISSEKKLYSEKNLIFFPKILKNFRNLKIFWISENFLDI